MFLQRNQKNITIFVVKSALSAAKCYRTNMATFHIISFVIKINFTVIADGGLVSTYLKFLVPSEVLFLSQ